MKLRCRETKPNLKMYNRKDKVNGVDISESDRAYPLERVWKNYYIRLDRSLIGKALKGEKNMRKWEGMLKFLMPMSFFIRSCDSPNV